MSGARRRARRLVAEPIGGPYYPSPWSLTRQWSHQLSRSRECSHVGGAGPVRVAASPVGALTRSPPSRLRPRPRPRSPKGTGARLPPLAATRRRARSSSTAPATMSSRCGTRPWRSRGMPRPSTLPQLLLQRRGSHQQQQQQQQEEEEQQQRGRPPSTSVYAPGSRLLQAATCRC